ncbi:MAG TPA: CaiB/BaiF CoA-transferase family protein [Casimicrobiaceae bacterium]|jgi:formyl-CoA transferase|nr:CaiB/BaiF CoA-transferase family protein [Casimicrobiaceae bacterium]
MHTKRPLADLKVLELGQLIAGPFAGKVFAEFGAEVIKVEPPAEGSAPGGDPLRQWRLLHEGTSLWWYVQARNKKSVTVNLRSPEGQEIVRRLARESDIVIENFRPGTLEKWGLDYEALAADNPGLIMVRLSGFGQTGPYRDQPGFGAIAESMGGMRHVTGFPDRPPVRMNISIGDALAALHGVIGALIALHHREAHGGKGQVIDVALYEAVFNMMESLVPDYDLFGEIRGRIGTGLTNIVPSNTYATRDGKDIVIGGNADSIYKRLMHAIGRDDLGQDPSLATNVGRVKRTAEIDGAIAAWTAERDLDEILAGLKAADVPHGKIYTAADVVEDAQYLAREMIVQTKLPDGTTLKLPGVVPKLLGTPGSIDWVGPALGQHTQEVLRAAGYTDEEIAKLRAAGAI